MLKDPWLYTSFVFCSLTMHELRARNHGFYNWLVV